MSDSFGRRLRIERERRKIPLTSVADKTKISIVLLEGLERDDLSRWPTGIFRRSFLRAYAEAIGLDREPLLREFLTLFPDPSEPRRDVRGAETSPPADESAPRLTLAESWSPFAGGLRLVRAPRRWAVAAWDLALLIAVAAGAFVMFGKFWLPLAVAALFYYVGGVLMLGNTPGVCLFGPVPQEELMIFPERTDEQVRDDLLTKEPPKNRRDPLKLVRRA